MQDQEASTAGTSSPGSGSSGSPKRAGRRAGQLSSLGSTWEPDQVKALERGWTNLAYKPVPELRAEPSKEVSSGAWCMACLFDDLVLGFALELRAE